MLTEIKSWLFGLLLLVLLPIAPVQAFELETRQVTDNVYALVGEIGPRTKENGGLNNTLGFVVTDEGVLLVSSGTTPDSAQQIVKAISQTTDKPIVQVINIGSQDHHWMGNTWFLEQKIPVMALARTVAVQEEHASTHQQRLAQALEQKPEDFSYAHADTVIDADEHRFNLGGVDFELRYLGDAHFAGDAVLWLPQQKVVFAGDVVYHDRTLGVQPSSNVLAWQETFGKLAALQPDYVVPGHGYPGDMEKARQDTGNYLDWLVEEVGKSLEDMEELGDTVQRLSAESPFKHLKFHDSWDPTNLNRTYLQMEVL